MPVTWVARMGKSRRSGVSWLDCCHKMRPHTASIVNKVWFSSRCWNPLSLENVWNRRRYVISVSDSCKIRLMEIRYLCCLKLIIRVWSVIPCWPVDADVTAICLAIECTSQTGSSPETNLMRRTKNNKRTSRCRGNRSCFLFGTFHALFSAHCPSGVTEVSKNVLNEMVQEYTCIISFAISVRLPILMSQLDSLRTYLNAILYLRVLLKSVGTFRFWGQSDSNNGHFAWRSTCISSITRWIFVGIRKVSARSCREKWSSFFCPTQFLLMSLQFSRHLNRAVAPCVHFLVSYYLPTALPDKGRANSHKVGHCRLFPGVFPT
jgi:hypothetical protein